MATLTVWKFETAEGAQDALNKLGDLAKQQLIQIQDAAVVAWPAGAKKPKTKNYGSMTGQGALSGAFWGMLFGLIFFVPFFGLAIGAAMGALAGKFADYGIDDNFIKKMGEQICPDSSALFVLLRKVTIDKVLPELSKFEGTVLQTSLSDEQEQRLRNALSHHTAAA